MLPLNEMSKPALIARCQELKTELDRLQIAFAAIYHEAEVAHIRATTPREFYATLERLDQIEAVL